MNTDPGMRWWSFPTVAHRARFLAAADRWTWGIRSDRLARAVRRALLWRHGARLGRQHGAHRVAARVRA